MVTVCLQEYHGSYEWSLARNNHQNGLRNYFGSHTELCVAIVVVEVTFYLGHYK